MRIVAINASHRGDKGLTRVFIDRIFHGVAQAGADCQVITLAKLEIDRCQTDQSHLTCVYNDRI